MTTEIIDIINVIALSAFAGGTSFIGTLMSKYINFAEPQDFFKFDLYKDIRYTTFNTIAGLARSVKLYFIFRIKYMNTLHLKELFTFFKPVNDIDINDENTNLMTKDFDDLINFGFFQSSFSMVESRYRVFYKYLVTSNNNMMIKEGNISTIFDDIASSIKLSEEEKNAFYFFKTIRNLIHNNGIHTQKDIIMHYRGNSYFFPKYDAPNFENLLSLMLEKILPDNIKILNKIITVNLSKFKKIEDPFARSE